jgi:FdhD protein
MAPHFIRRLTVRYCLRGCRTAQRLDKLIGAFRRQGNIGEQGIVRLTSRVSIELIQKTASLGASILVAVSVPSTRAVRDAQMAGITLIAIARDDGFEIFTYPERII